MPPAVDPKELQAQHQRYLALKDLIIDSNTRATTLGVAALKTVIVMNGAAAIALLAFLSQVVVKDAMATKLAGQMLQPLALLVWGVMAGGLATGFGYFRMYLEGHGYGAEIKKAGGLQPWGYAANGCLAVAIVLAVVAYALFAVGVLDAGEVLASMLKNR